MTDVCLLHPSEPVRIFDPMMPLGMASIGTVSMGVGIPYGGR